MIRRRWSLRLSGVEYATMVAAPLKKRIYSVDLLRGIVMMIMLLDHTREFVHAGALQSDPTNPETTTAAVFFTRWITHFCAPLFVFLSGVSIYLQRRNGKPDRELSWFLLTRGVWLVILEFTVIRFLVTFNFDYGNFAGFAQVIWVIGVAMICMAGLIYLPLKIVGIAGVLMIVLHNLLDPLSVPPNIAFSGQADLSQSIWIILHQMGAVPIGSSTAFFVYPLIPWIGVMMAGFALGKVFDREEDRRIRVLLWIGLTSTVLFFVLRAVNVYGDPAAWRFFDTGVQTVLSFFNVTKYPPSLLFLLMTIGPGLIVLAMSDRIEGNSLWQRICIAFGRVPLFFYFLQWLWAHLAGLALAYLAGVDTDYMFLDPFRMGQAAPPGHGFSLPIVYAVWIVGLIAVYPLCVWWGNLKARNKHWMLSYL